ncbi:MAG TPA: hypothetical protein EYP76_02745, partial [Thiomicrorhabdus sp.]|nr:hypothetical protein [Thiomicrorhabdus sp.]
MKPIHVKHTPSMTEFDHLHQHIADHSKDGLVLLSAQLIPLLINQSARQYINTEAQPNDIFKHLDIYTQKRKNIQFNLKEWICSCSFSAKQNCVKTPMLWIKTSHQKTLIPVIFQLSKIKGVAQQTENYLLLIQNQTSKIEEEAKGCLIKNSGTGQFMT